MKTIVYAARAERALEKMPPDARDRVEGGLERYALTGHGDVKAMQGVPLLRMRIGHYRVLFTETLEILDVADIGPRGGIYR